MTSFRITLVVFSLFLTLLTGAQARAGQTLQQFLNLQFESGLDPKKLCIAAFSPESAIDRLARPTDPAQREINRVAKTYGLYYSWPATADSRPFSENLLASVYGYKHRLYSMFPETRKLSEPDYQRWFDRMLEPITHFGLELFKRLQGRTLIDLGSGKIDEFPIVRLLAQAAGCRRYIGVDAFQIDSSHKIVQTLRRQLRGTTETSEVKFESYFVKADMLGFLSHLQKSDEPLAFLIGGIEPWTARSSGMTPEELQLSRELSEDRYPQAVLQEIKRLSNKGDFLILNTVYGFSPEQSGYREVTSINSLGVQHGRNGLFEVETLSALSEDTP